MNNKELVLTSDNLPAMMDADMRRSILLEKNKGRVCIVPFLRFDVWSDGSVPVCCTDWMQGDVIIGNVFRQEVSEIWNSPTAKRIRRSVTDGTFAHCTERCPMLSGMALPLRESLTQEHQDLIRSPEADLEKTPEFIKLVNDDSCNLSCPSCRSDVFIENNTNAEKIFEANMRIIYPLLKNAKTLDVLGNGEAIASKATMKLLGALDAKTHKNLSIDLLTNATHFNENSWERLKNIHPLDIRLNISMDGASKESYEKLRRGGGWEAFNRNMEFISELRQSEKISKLTINFTVQSENYRELPIFGEFARKYKADRVLLFRFSRWAHMNEEYYVDADIFNRAHPLHADFLSTLRGLNDPIVELGPLSVFL